MKTIDEMLSEQNQLGGYAKKDQYLKIPDGSSVEGVFTGGMLAFYRVYGDLTRYEHKPNSQAAYKVGATFTLLPDFTPKAIEMGAKLWAQVKKALRTHGKDAVYKIRRIGTEKSTVYVLDFVRALSPLEIDQAANVDSFRYTYNSINSNATTLGEDNDPEINTQLPGAGVEDELEFV